MESKTESKRKEHLHSIFDMSPSHLPQTHQTTLGWGSHIVHYGSVFSFLGILPDHDARKREGIHKVCVTENMPDDKMNHIIRSNNNLETLQCEQYIIAR